MGISLLKILGKCYMLHRMSLNLKFKIMISINQTSWEICQTLTKFLKWLLYWSKGKIDQYVKKKRKEKMVSWSLRLVKESMLMYFLYYYYHTDNRIVTSTQKWINQNRVESKSENTRKVPNSISSSYFSYQSSCTFGSIPG